MMDPEVHTLTGAYVCHALDAAERAAFEHHLGRCPTCAQEVAELREATALLAFATAQTPPARLKAAVDARIVITRQIPPGIEWAAPRPAVKRPRRRWFAAVGWGVAASLTAAVTVLGLQVGDQQHRLDQARDRATAVSRLLSASDARSEHATVRTGGSGVVVVSHRQDEAAITLQGLARLNPDQTYQLWMIGPTGIRSGGLLPTDSAGTASVLAHGLGDAQTIGLTVEPAAGSAQPTTTPIMILPMPA